MDILSDAAQISLLYLHSILKKAIVTSAEGFFFSMNKEKYVFKKPKGFKTKQNNCVARSTDSRHRANSNLNAT